MVDPRAELDALVDGGRRAPGSEPERAAARRLARRLGALGLKAALEPVAAWPRWPLALALLAALSVAASVVSVGAAVPGAALALVAAVVTFLEAGMLLSAVRRLLGRRASQNVVARTPGERPGALFLVAHLDAGKGGLAARLPIGVERPLLAAQLAVLVCCVLRVAGLDGTALTAVQLAPTALLVVAGALLIDAALAPTRRGENDNGSGVALALLLAERFAAAPPEHFGVHVLLTGAGTAGAAGMRTFLARHELDPERTVFLELDAVGAGPVRYTRRSGALLPIRSHDQLFALCEEIAADDPDAGAEPVSLTTSGDAYAARAAGFPAITISGAERRSARVEEIALRRAAAFCGELIERIDADVGAGLPVSPAAPR